MKLASACILNQGNGSWAFEEHAQRLSSALWLEVQEVPTELNFVLGWEKSSAPPGATFIPWNGIGFAADKRLQAAAFSKAGIPTPKTLLIDSVPDLMRFVSANSQSRWVLKYPTSCGASGHCFVTPTSEIRPDWPIPFVVQRFIELPSPEVYRLYCVAGNLFGWNARRFPIGTRPSPWVAHAKGARYVHLDNAPAEAVEAARAALEVADLASSFGAVDLLPDGENWLVLEVGTDGVHNHVDRDFENETLELEINRRLAEAFWRWTPAKPWGSSCWHMKPRPATVVA